MAMNLQAKLVITGTALCNTQNNNVPGEGTYAEKGYIYAAITGTVDIKEIVEEDVKYNQISILSSIKNKSAQLKIGSIIIGRVTRIKEDSAYVKILIIDGQPTYQNLEGMIRKVNVRETEIDKVQMEKSFIPGDIVKAKLISFGDSSKIYLSTESEELGVVFAKNKDTKELMLPFDWQQVISLTTGQKEFRKVAKPDLSIFE